MKDLYRKGLAKWMIGLVVVTISTVTSIQAQDEEITDEQLKQYASITAQIDTLKAEMKANINELVKGHELMDKGRTFNAIKKTKGDSVKIAELEVTPEQLEAYDAIVAEIDTQKSSFKENYSALIKEEIGAGLYNKVKKALRKDEDLKARYDALVAEMQATADSGGEEEQG